MKKKLGTNVYLKPIKAGECYLFILYIQRLKTVLVDYLQHSLSSKKYIHYKNNNTNQKIKLRYYWNFSNPYLANVPIEFHTLNTPTAHGETNHVIVIKKLID